MGEYLIGIDLGGTRIKAVAVHRNGEELSRAEETTADGDAGSLWRDKVRALLDGFKKQYSEPQAVGLSAPGLASADARSIAYMPGRLQGLENFRWDEFLETPTAVLNDAHAVLLGEVWLGAARGKQDVVLLTLGTGVGGAILSAGQLLRGTIGRAGHLGHISCDVDGALDIVGTPGSLEDAIGDHSVSRRSQGRFISSRELVQAYREGDTIATEVWLRSLRALAAGIVSLTNVLDPEIVVLGGGVARAGDDLLKPLGAFLDQIEWRPGGHRVPIVLATRGDYAGALGAAYYALNKPN